MRHAPPLDTNNKKNDMNNIKEEYKEAIIDQVKQEDTKTTMDQIDILNDQKETSMMNDKAKIS